MEFYGHNIAGTELEVLALQIEAEHRAGEPALMVTKWFDYRLMHPTTATYLFAHHYKQAVRTWAEKTRDIESAKKVRAFAPADVFKSPDATGMWNARACADALGIAYPLFLQFAADRALYQMWKKFPRPNQLYGDEVVTDLKAAIEGYRAHILLYSREPFFLAPQFTGHPLQVEHRRMVIDRIVAKGRSPAQLGRMFHEQVLDPRAVGEWFTPEVIEAACGIATQLRAQ